MAELSRERIRELYEDLARARAAATAPMDRRDFKAWARVILLKHELGLAVSNYALSCAREAIAASAGPAPAQPFTPPPTAPQRVSPDDGYDSILEATEGET